MQAVLAGDIAFAVSDFGAALPHLKSGRLKAIATTGARRGATLPDVPTIKESGYPNYEVTGWNGVFAPTGTPEPVVARLNRDIARVAAMPAYADRIRTSANAEATSTTLAEAAAKQKADTARRGALIKSSGISLSN